MRIAQIRVTVVMTAVLAVASVTAQDSTDGLVRRGPKPGAGPEGPLLTFQLAAFDAKGEPFRDLRDIDIEIHDDGKKIQAAYCRLLETPGVRPAPVDVNEYVNRLVNGDTQATVVLFDLLNSNLNERSSGWKDLVAALKKVESPDRVYLYLLTEQGTLYAVRALPDAGRPATPGDGAWVGQVDRLMDQSMQAVSSHRAEELQANPDALARQTIALVQALVADFEAQPGRKNLVWITQGFPTYAAGADGLRHDYTAPIDRLGSDLNRAGVTLYAVEQGNGAEGVKTLQALVDLTSGRRFSRSQIDDALRAGSADGHVMYEVGYRPPAERWDDKFHKLRITAIAKGGAHLRVRAISGYFGDQHEADPQSKLVLAARGPFDLSEIGIRASGGPSQRGKGWVHLKTRVDARDLHFTGDQTFTGEILMAVAYYTDGWQPDLSEESFPTHLNEQQHEAALRDGVTFLLDRPLRPGVSKVRIVVREPQSGEVGSLTIPVRSLTQ